MADSLVPVTGGSGYNVDTRTNADGHHRQVVVLGHESSTDAVAAVQATDPASNVVGLVVRDVNTSAIAAQLASGVTVTGTITGITNSIAVHVLSTGGTLQVQNLTTGTVAMSAKDGSFAVYFSPGTPAVSPIGSQANTPFRTNTDGALKIYDIVTGTINSVATVGNITGSVAVYFDRGQPAVEVYGSDGTTDRQIQTNSSGALKIYDIVTGTINTVASVTNITNSISVHLLSTNGTLSVFSRGSGTFAIAAADGTLAVRFSPANPGVNLALAGGNAVITPNSGIPAINVYNTTSIFTVSGSTSGGTTSGVTLVAPSSAYNFKVFAYSLQTTGIVSEAWRFTNGAGSETELWRPLITAVETTSTPKGANMAVQPPGFIFATGTNTTLALKSSTGSLVHYSVSYIKESA